jgi:hypothetical protein
MSREEFWVAYESRMRSQFNDQPHLETFLCEMKMAFAWMIQNQQVHLLESNGGLAAIFASSELDETWSFGFLLLPKDNSNRVPFWETLKHRTKEIGAKKLSGPIQGTTYFPYRFISESDGTAFFRGEYFSSVDEHDFLMVQKPSDVKYFRSGYRTTFDGIMHVSKPYYDGAVEKGFEVKTHSEVNENLFRSVFDMVGNIFGMNWNFNAMTADEVQAFYKSEFGVRQRMALQTLHLNGEMIGFCRYIENDSQTLICKTLGVLPKYQKLGLGNAAVYEMHRSAQEAGYNRMIYALIYDGNRVQQNMPKDDSIIFRKYAAYEYDL